jgi:PIN domain nuclease of toxin-antitoxin system
MSVYVTDTHPLVWYAAGQHGKLSKKVSRIFDKAWNDQAFIYIPTAVLWEIAILLKIGQIKMPEPFESWAAVLTRRQGFDIAVLDVEIIAKSMKIFLNDDPFDEAIVATALIKDLTLITKDAAITDSGIVEVIW